MRMKTLWLTLSILSTGATGLIYEYILSTVSSYILGNSIEQFSITIAVMLLFMGLGGYFQKKLSDKNLVEKFITVELSISLLGSLLVITVYLAYIHLENFYLVYYLLASITGLLIGLEIPIVLRINEKYQKSLKENLSLIYSADFLGAFIGALVWVYLLLKYFSIIQIGYIVSSVNLLIAFITFIIFKRNLKRNVLIIIVSISIFILNVLGFTFSKKIEAYLQKSMFKDPVIYHKRTNYQDITITKNVKNGELRLYINGNLQFCSTDERLYHELLVHPPIALLNELKNVLVLGGGDGLAVRELLKYGNINITLVELDKGMIEIAKEKPLSILNENAFYNKNVKVINEDAFIYLDRLIKSKKKFDLVIVDFPDPSNINLAKLYSLEFYRKIYKILNFNGIVSIQATSPYFASKTYLCIEKTLKMAGFNTLKYHYDIPSFGDWGFILAYKGRKDLIENKLKNFSLKILDTYFLTDELFKASLIFPKNWLKYSEKDIKINTIFNPVIIKYYNEENRFDW